MVGGEESPAQGGGRGLGASRDSPCLASSLSLPFFFSHLKISGGTHDNQQSLFAYDGGFPGDRQDFRGRSRAKPMETRTSWSL